MKKCKKYYNSKVFQCESFFYANYSIIIYYVDFSTKSTKIHQTNNLIQSQQEIDPFNQQNTIFQSKLNLTGK